MEITIDSRGAVTAKDNLFVANASGWGEANQVIIYFEGDWRRVDYALISFKRADGFYIRDLLCEEVVEKDENEEVINKWWVYEIQDDDGVLYVAGALQVSVQLKHDILVNDVKVSTETLAGVSCVAQVQRNIGIHTQEEYDSAKELVDEVLLPIQREISRLNTGYEIRLNGERLVPDNNRVVDINAVPTRLNVLNSASTAKADRQTARLYVDSNGQNTQITLQQVKDLGTKIVSVESEEDVDGVLSDLDAGDYIYVKN